MYTLKALFWLIMKRKHEWRKHELPLLLLTQAFGEFFGAATLEVKKVGVVSSMTMLIFLLAGGYYVQVRLSCKLQVGTNLITVS